MFAPAYRYYSAFLAAKVLVIDDRRTTPAYTFSGMTICVKPNVPNLLRVHLRAEGRHSDTRRHRIGISWFAAFRLIPPFAGHVV